MKASRAALAFDVLFCVRFGERTYGGVSDSECQAIAFLARMLAAYSQPDTSWWGYQFSTTRTGAPFSAELNDMVSWLIDQAFVAHEERVLLSRPAGIEMLASIAELPDVLVRQRYLDAACLVCAALPLPSVLEALFEDPQLRMSAKVSEPRELFTELSEVILRDRLDAVSQAISDPDREAIFQAAVVYVRYLSTYVGEDGAG